MSDAGESKEARAYYEEAIDMAAGLRFRPRSPSPDFSLLNCS